MEVWVSVTPDSVADTQINILNGNNYFTYGANLAQGDNLVEQVPLEMGHYLVEVIANAPGDFTLQLSTEELPDPATLVPPPEIPDVTLPIELNLPEIIVPEVEQDNSLSGLLILAAAIAVLLLLVLLPPTIGITVVSGPPQEY